MTTTHDGARHDTTKRPGLQGRPASAIEQTQRVFHELHADGRHALCSVCDGRYRPALCQIPTWPWRKLSSRYMRRSKYPYRLAGPREVIHPG